MIFSISSGVMDAMTKAMVSREEVGTNSDMVSLQAAFCTIFSSPVRLQMMILLGDGEQSVGALAEQLNVSMANVSQHLRLMRNQGAVGFRREGKTVYYRVANPKFVEGMMKVREGLLEEFRKKGGIV